MAKLIYKSNNLHAPWVCMVGKNSTLWIAYPSFLKALFNLPRLAWSFRNHG